MRGILRLELFLLAACATQAPAPPQPVAEASVAPAPPASPAPIASPGSVEDISPAEGAAHLISDMNAPENALTLPPAHNVAGAQYVGRYRVCVDEAGRVQSVTPIQSSGAPAVDDLWTETMRRWRFRPWVREGRALAFCYPQRIEVSSKS